MKAGMRPRFCAFAISAIRGNPDVVGDKDHPIPWPVTLTLFGLSLAIHNTRLAGAALCFGSSKKWFLPRTRPGHVKIMAIDVYSIRII